MSTEPKTERPAWTHRIGGIGRTIIALVGLLFGSGVFYFAYESFVNVPDVVYAVLPTYELEGLSFSGLVVENRGKATAHDVRMSLGRLGTTIEQTSVQSQESWRQEGGGAGEATLAIWLDRMTTGSSVTVYLLTEKAPQLDGLAVTTEEGPGRVAGGQSVAALILPVLFGMVLGGGVASGIWWWFYQRLKGWVAVMEGYVEALKQGRSLLETLNEAYKEELQEWRSGNRFPPRPSVVR
jgi:hypothetical protein